MEHPQLGNFPEAIERLWKVFLALAPLIEMHGGPSTSSDQNENVADKLSTSVADRLSTSSDAKNEHIAKV